MLGPTSPRSCWRTSGAVMPPSAMRGNVGMVGPSARPPANWLTVLGLHDAIDAYERRAGPAPAPPQAVAGLLEVEMFKRKLRQRGLAELLEVPETSLSEILSGKRAMNLDFARRLHERLGVPAEVALRLRDVA